MTGQQITKFLELSKQIHDKIDVLDVATLVQAVTQVYNERQAVGKQGLADDTDETAAAEESPPADGFENEDSEAYIYHYSKNEDE